MNRAALGTDSLVLYKIRPARVLAVGEKIEIELEGGQVKRVRPKDIALLHPGPLRSLEDLDSREGELAEAWELLQGSETTLGELAELMFDELSPATAWAAWRRVAEGLYFEGTPELIRARSREDVERDRAERDAKAAAQRDWAGFLERIKQGKPQAQDAQRLREVERLALGQSTSSRILQALGYQETAQSAHRALIQIGFWPEDYNPYPARNGLPAQAPSLPVVEIDPEQRLDLTHLGAYAIDDEGNLDPDDALSIDGNRLWVHVADVAAAVAPDSAIDIEARSRGTNQYLPERTVNMLPEQLTARLGLGLQPISPALSFGMTCDEKGELSDIEVHASLVKVQRLTYGVVEQQLSQSPFDRLDALTSQYRARRMAGNAVDIQFPEVSVRVRDGEVIIRPLPRLRSRALVTEAMLMAGAAAARFCHERDIPIPFATQAAPDRIEHPTDLAAMYAYRRRLRPTRPSTEPGPHFGLGLPLYTRATSPLRRYSDLLVHQQLRAWLANREVLDGRQVNLRGAEADAAAATARRSERLSNQHWKLVYLRAQSRWRGEGIVVEKGEHKAVVLIPELALEERLRLRTSPALNARIKLAVRDVDLPELACYFQASAG